MIQKCPLCGQLLTLGEESGKTQCPCCGKKFKFRQRRKNGEDSPANARAKMRKKLWSFAAVLSVILLLLGGLWFLLTQETPSGVEVSSRGFASGGTGLGSGTPSTEASDSADADLELPVRIRKPAPQSSSAETQKKPTPQAKPAASAQSAQSKPSSAPQPQKKKAPQTPPGEKQAPKKEPKPPNGTASAIPAAGLPAPGGIPGNGKGGGTHEEIGRPDQFYGLDITGNSLFIVDISGSMSSHTAEGPTRIEILKMQLKNSIVSTFHKKKNNCFGIIAFSDDQRLFPQDFTGHLPCFGRAADVADALKFCQRLSTEGGTDMMAAWERVVQMMQQGKLRVDTIFFLSDGQPSDCSMEDLAEFIRRMIPRDITIHTVSIGTRSAGMKRISDEHGGKHREIL